MQFYRYSSALFAAALAVALSTDIAAAQKKYDTGASDTEIKIGNLHPYSGPASAYSVLGKIEEAFFKKINAEGGINGRKITFITYDDGYSPAKAVEQTRKLVEGDEVLLVFGSLGTAPNTAVQKYLNGKKIPQLFVGSGASKWNDPKNFPWSMGLTPNYFNEGQIYANYLLKEKPAAKVAILFQNDDYGKDYLVGFKQTLGSKASSMIVAEAAYEVTEPTVDSQMVKLKASGADVFLNITTPKFAAQAIKKAAEMGWKPLHLLNSVSNSIGSVLKPVGLESAQEIVSAAYYKDLNDKRWDNDKGLAEMKAVVDKYYPEANRGDAGLPVGYLHAAALAQVLKQAGDNLTRENIMKEAANLKDFEVGVLLPGIKINTSPTDFAPIEQWQLIRFKGENWELFGDLMTGG